MRSLRVLVSLAGITGMIALVPIVHRSPDTTYGGADLRLLALEVGAGLALLVIAATRKPEAGALCLALAGAAWFTPELAGAAGVSLHSRTLWGSVGPMLAVLALFALVHRPPRVSVQLRLLLFMSAIGAGLATVARLVLIDPFEEPDCWRTCERNPLLLIRTDVAGTVDLIGLAGLAVGALGAAALVLPRLLADRDSESPADVVGWALLAGLIGSFFVAPDGLSATDDELAVGLFVFVQACAIAWLILLSWETGRRWWLRARVARHVDLLISTSDPDALVRRLRNAVQDPALRVSYWAPARESYVDPNGQHAGAPAPDPGERVTVITRQGQTIAAITHSRRVRGQRLERAFGPAIRLALENAQLRAAALAELSELTSSRVRVVQRAELERRRLERNLHDGAQQRAVSMALLVRLFTERASPTDAEAARRAQVLTRTLVEELRRVARGIYPAVLADAGLVGGIIDLAERSTDLPVVVDEFPDSRYSGTVETTAYLLVRTAIESARDHGATSLTVTGTDIGGTLRVSVEDDVATSPFDIAAELADQVGALGGTLVLNGAPSGRRAEVVLPCGS